MICVICSSFFFSFSLISWKVLPVVRAGKRSGDLEQNHTPQKPVQENQRTRQNGGHNTSEHNEIKGRQLWGGSSWQLSSWPLSSWPLQRHGGRGHWDGWGVARLGQTSPTGRLRDSFPFLTLNFSVISLMIPLVVVQFFFCFVFFKIGEPFWGRSISVDESLWQQVMCYVCSDIFCSLVQRTSYLLSLWFGASSVFDDNFFCFCFKYM